MSDRHASLAPQFDTLEQQAESGKMGMWLFLATEIMVFAGLFCVYAVYRTTQPEVFEFAGTYINTALGAASAVVLIASSWTVAMAVRSAKLGEQQKTSLFLALTLFGAVALLGIKSVEYGEKFAQDLTWGLSYDPANSQPSQAHLDAWAATQASEVAAQAESAERQLASAAPVYSVVEPGSDLVSSSTIPVPPAYAAPRVEGEKPATPFDPQKIRNVHVFFGIYFCMTGLHTLCVLVGALALLWVLLRNVKGEFSAAFNLPVDLAGLYWHFVNLIWIFLFPLLYLIA